jgi:hypothetical protein
MAKSNLSTRLREKHDTLGSPLQISKQGNKCWVWRIHSLVSSDLMVKVPLENNESENM